jgi:hypothetical protein
MTGLQLGSSPRSAMLTLLRYQQQLLDDYRAFVDQIQTREIPQESMRRKRGQDYIKHAGFQVFHGTDQFKPWVQIIKHSFG